jgi:hypothetical protein
MQKAERDDEKEEINKMSMIYCPECGHEISSEAVACPSCGRPTGVGHVAPRPVVVAAAPRTDDGLPKWIFIPIAVLGGLLLLVLFLVFSRESGNEDDLSVNVNARRTTTVPSRDVTAARPTTTQSETQTVTVPGAQSDVSTVDPPKSNPTRGTVTIEARVSGRSGSPIAVRREKFYLLDKDLESILSESDIEPIEGQTLANSFGLSVLYPSRYGEINREALRAINDHIKYSGTTDEGGKLQMSGVEPDSYYLFGITKVGNGFALWSSPVSIIAGENNLNLSPQRLIEIAME